MVDDMVEVINFEDRKIFYIEVGDMTVEDIKNYIENIKSEIREKSE